ncbi:hypothetical protein CFBP7900_22410 [Xanthomonas hortorum pv. carotae]|uniref:Uncharacterized protein n=1 Tax=Xanthomonas hortorum pv. carotae TaxID=487904 RepID=A0A6V7DKW0_9XANT|nr:hypothetical protein CFBP7900_05800 [Xanthomonas hortorum pv. carotae]CAD0307713.1 hypothetical protein CFBP7900_05800 [Xanthomonas hortorum pv. carotae]CAD0336250.1 hypothetical protein CFBP7900_22410 [Xanthomonas hortorum pv. carotae]CAD0336259.1 hypothetical protein CFBP7900_22410 [Xanthomonas hortorum pv. carotae]
MGGEQQGDEYPVSLHGVYGQSDLLPLPGQGIG